MRRPSFLAAFLLFLGLAAPALAYSESGTHAWSTRPLVLSSGPGTAYHTTGEIPENAAIKVLRCQRLWCLVDGPGGRGWTSKDRIAFGKTPTDWPGGINPDYPAGGPGEVCFYSGTNYTGFRFCAETGRVVQDFALLNLDNQFQSVELIGNVSVAACRDRFFQSYCERIIVSQPVLDQYLRRNLTSVRVY
ncbi:peptidase inhibitor family I36 protein [Devosia submarina]|uniref:peptidase inhibitor family I36 protein n=1 Tax=Devosia submarina TaxID=1173082 RepID=UPI000D334DC5|nr:peptidase inhibitor family I36 protein [Devosia submarina]